MDKREVSLLKSDLLENYENIEKIYNRIQERLPDFKDSPQNIDSMAYQLHNLYGAYEELFEIVAGFFENQIKGSRYHIDLLRRMKTEIEGFRPALISHDTYELLYELQRFFHFFRHAYSSELNSHKIDMLVQIAIQLKAQFRKDMDTFLDQLRPED